MPPSWEPISLVEFGGIVDTVDADTPAGYLGAFEALNVEFKPNQIGHRKPLFGVLYDPTTPDTTPMGLAAYQQNDNITWLVYGSNSEFRLWPLDQVFLRQAYSLGGSGVPVSCAFGRRIYAAFSTVLLGSGPTPVVASQVAPYFTTSTVFSGSGLNDATISSPTVSSIRSIRIVIDGIGTPDTFKVSTDGGRTYILTGQAITGVSQGFNGGTVAFVATTGHTLNDAWTRTYQSHYIDYLLQGPYTYTPGALTEPGAGVVTAGAHVFGYVIEHRGGFLGRPSPDSGSTANPGTYLSFQPVSFTATGGANLQWVLNPTVWPSTAVRVHIVMSPAYDKNRLFFVPGTATDVPGGSASSKTITFNIDDATLVARGVEATHLLRQITASGTASTTGTEYGTLPFTPYALLRVGDRMLALYRNNSTGSINIVGNTQIAVSERNKPESFLAPECFITPERDIITACYMLGRVYVFGANYTGWTIDNGLTPAEWPQLTTVSNTIGTQSLRGVWVSADGTEAWVLSSSGLFLLNSSGYSAFPVSFWQSKTWNSILWSSINNPTRALNYCVVDNEMERYVDVIVDYDVSNPARAVFRFDYSRGKDPSSIRMSRVTHGSGTLIYSATALLNTEAPVLIGSGLYAGVPPLRLVMYGASTGFLTDRGFNENGDNEITGITGVKSDSLWLTGASRVSYAIDFDYQPVFPTGDSHIHIAHALQLSAFGSGTLSPVLYDKDKLNSFTVGSITLAAAPGVDYFRECQQISELFSMRFRVNAAGSWCRINGVVLFQSVYARSR